MTLSPGAVFLPWAKVGKKYIREVSVTHTWEVCMIFDTLPWSNVVPTRSYFTYKWINEKFKNWTYEFKKFSYLDPVEVQHWSQTFYKSWIKSSKEVAKSGNWSLPLQVMDMWSPVDTEVSYKSWSVVLEICAQMKLIQSCNEQKSCKNLKWNMNCQPSHKEVKTKDHL